MITHLQLGRMGRLGNALFEVAGCIGIARKSGQPFAFPKLILHDMVERFDTGEDHELYKYLKNPLPEVPDFLQFQSYPYFWEYRDIDLPTGNWSIDAHLQSVKWFDHCIDEVRHFFTFKQEYLQSDYNCIHYRAGDYIDNLEAYHPRQPIEYYQRALGHFDGREKYIVFSDDIEEAKLRLRTLLPGNTLYCNEDYIETFKMMKSCKSFICANSSFSHMAALLGTHPEKKIIMPRLWFGAQANGLSFDSLYPPEAIVI